MEPKEASTVSHDLKTRSLQESLLKECRVMTDYCLANGRNLDPGRVAVLAKADSKIKAHELLPVYNYLLALVKPATPGTLVLFEKNRQSTSRFKFLGPLPIVRNFMLVTILSLLALIGISLSPHVNATSIELSMLQGSGWDQVQRLAFLLAAASVGASFYALFKMNSYISDGTFDMKYSSTYWSRYVLGLVAGILLSEMFIVFIGGSAEIVDTHIREERGLSETELLDTARFLLKPILAILGGFSANLVYRILNRLIEAVESVFKGSAEEQIAIMQEEVKTYALEMENNLKTTTAQQLLSLKNELISNNVNKEALGKLDDAIGGLVSIPLAATEFSMDYEKFLEEEEEQELELEGSMMDEESELATEEEELNDERIEEENNTDEDNPNPTASW